MEHGAAAPAGHHFAGDVARGRHAIIGAAGTPEAVELANHPRRRPRRIGDQDHGAAAGPETLKGLACLRMGMDPVMDHAPDIAQNHVIARREGEKRSSRWNM